MRRIPDDSEGAKRILELADKHVVTVGHFSRDFSSRAAAYRTAAKLRKAGRLKNVGFVRGISGRPVAAYCNSWRPRSNQLRHEVLLTDFLICYPTAKIVRGWAVDSRIRPDAEMMLDDQKFFVELDTGEQSYRQVERRQQVYHGTNDFLLYVTMTEARLAGLIRHSESVREFAFFTTLDRVMADPQGNSWTVWSGAMTSIMEQSKK